MSNDINLRQLWHSQKLDVPDVNELFKKADVFKRRSLYKLMIASTCLVVTSLFIIYIWYYFQPQMLSTKFGILLVLLAMLMYIAVNFQMFPFLKSTSYTNTTKEYLLHLIKFKEKQLYLHRTITNIYFLLLSIGISLYLIEYVLKMTLVGGSSTYVVTFVWITLNWFYFKPRIIKKQQEKITELIKQFHTINEQFRQGI